MGAYLLQALLGLPPISIVGAGVAASGETETAAPESSGEVISMSVRLGGGDGAEEVEGRWEGAAVSGSTVGVATVGAVTSAEV